MYQGSDAPAIAERLATKVEADRDDATATVLSELDQEAALHSVFGRKLLLDGRAAFLTATETDLTAQDWLQTVPHFVLENDSGEPGPATSYRRAIC